MPARAYIAPTGAAVPDFKPGQALVFPGPPHKGALAPPVHKATGRVVGTLASRNVLGWRRGPTGFNLC